MARTLSSDMLAAVYGQETETVVAVLLEIDHDDLDAPLRYTNNGEDVTYDGETYLAMPFEVTLPEDREDVPPTARLSIDNIGREVVQAVRSIETAATVSLSVAMVNAVDDVTVEIGPVAMTLTDVEYDAYTVQGQLSFARILDEGFPGLQMMSNGFPGLWEARPSAAEWPLSRKSGTPTTSPAPRGWLRFGRWVPRRGNEPS